MFNKRYCKMWLTRINHAPRGTGLRASFSIKDLQLLLILLENYKLLLSYPSKPSWTTPYFSLLTAGKGKKITVVTRFTVLTKSRQVVQHLLASYFHNLSNARKGKLKRSGQKKSYSVRNFNLCTQTPTAINVKQRRSSQNDASTRLVTFSTKTRTLGFYLTKYM